MIKLFIIGLLICLIYLFLEYYILNARLKKIPIRILVNGTRGKSTTVRILYQILDRQNYRVYAKTTGNRPEILEPEGYLRLIKRHAPASIAENIRLLRKWGDNKTNAVVLEGMALHPEMQRTLSRFIFKPTHTVITNILVDHQEIMGESLTKNIRVISASIIRDTTLFTTQLADDLLRSSGIQTANRVLCKERRFAGDFENIPGEIINQSWSIVQSVSENIGWPQQHTIQCFSSIWESVDQYIKWDLSDLPVEFWNLFSMNDIYTTGQFIDHRLAKSGSPVPYVLLLNCRTDRPLRTKYFIGLIEEKYPEAEIWLTGSGRHLALNLLKKRHTEQAVFTGRIRQVLNKIRNGFSVKTLLFGIGNFKGMENFISRIETLSDSIQN